MTRWIAALLLIMATASAHAGPSLRLVTDGDVCDLSPLATGVEALVGSRVFDERGSASVVVHLDGSAMSPSADVTFDAGDGSARGPRHLEAASCDALLDAIALVIAIGVPEDAPGGAPHVQARARAIEPQRNVDSSSRLELRDHVDLDGDTVASKLAVTGGAALGVSSNGIARQIVIGVRWREPRTSLGLELRIEPSEDRAVVPAGRVEVSRTLASTRLCRHLGDLALCGAASVGVIRGTGTELFDARQAVSVTAAVGARVAWERELWCGMGARIEVGGDVFPRTSRFDVDHMPVWTSSRFEAQVGTGLFAHFP